MRIQRSMSAGNKKALLLSLVVTAALSLLPISAHATVDWTEGFEYADNTAFGKVWAASCLGNPGISTDRVRSGSKSVKLVYKGVAGVDPGAGGCFMDRFLPAKTDTLYTRIYIYLDNFTANSSGTKMLFAGQNSSYPNFWWEMLGSPNFTMVISGDVSGGKNLFGGPIPQNQWACLETRITMNTPGVANGIVQSWVNGTQQLNYTNLLLRGSTLSNFNGPNSQLQLVRLYVQHGWGTIYYDDYAVSRDARIGCSGSVPAGDTTPPAPPTGMVIK